MITSKQNKEKALGLWEKGADYYVFKIGKEWRLADCFGNFPIFKTKKQAVEAADTFILECCL